MSFDTNNCEHTNAVVTDVQFSDIAKMSKGSISVRCKDCGQVGIDHGIWRDSSEHSWISVAVDNYRKAQVLIGWS